MLKLYNSLSRQLEDFNPLAPSGVTMYTCGPTVYSYVTVGNFRTYTLSDILVRTLAFEGFKVKHVMNLTDVGHLTGDNAGDADIGDDRLEKAAEKEGRSAKDIADFYINDFMRSFSKLNLLKPFKFTRATEYIPQQIDLVRTLEHKGYTYYTSDGVYFDTSKFPEYGQLSGMTADSIKEGARVEVNPEKKHAADFALWKLSPAGSKRWQEWASPWGVGFPGWHAECSAMSAAELGPSIDIHVGGEDLRMIHHPNEIAQSECSTGKKFVKYWVHGAFLTVDGGRMSKSLHNAFTVEDIESRGYMPLALRYFYFSAHYRSPLNFTWESIKSANAALSRLYELISGYKEDAEATVSPEHLSQFTSALENDLNLPVALSVMWDVLKSDLPESQKLATVLKFDSVLGLRIEDHLQLDIPEHVSDLARTRMEYRKAGIWDKADLVRKQISELGYVVEDLVNGSFKIKKKF